MSAQEFQDLGYKMVIWPVSSLRFAARAQEDFYNHLFEAGRADGKLGEMQTRAELYDLIGYAEHEALDHTVLKTVLTEAMGVRATEKA
jgi:methylisocitrate lyase